MSIEERECQLREAYRQELSRQEHLFQQKEAELQRMEDVYRKVTETIRLELDNAKSENLNMREDYARARRSAEEISRHYEKDKTALNKESFTRTPQHFPCFTVFGLIVVYFYFP